VQTLSGRAYNDPMALAHPPESKFEAIHCTIVVRRTAPSVVVVTISGRDVAELGVAPFQELHKDITKAPIDLFIDARATTGASVTGSHQWSQWLQGHRARLRSIHVLTGGKFIQLTADFVRRFAQLGDVMRIYTAPDAFAEALCAAERHARS
jgi:hypothetical protein